MNIFRITNYYVVHSCGFYEQGNLMLSMQKPCTGLGCKPSKTVLLRDPRFIDCEKWRKDFGVDDLVRNFKYDEKPKVFEYYPQFYHKTDKVLALSVGT